MVTKCVLIVTIAAIVDTILGIVRKLMPKTGIFKNNFAFIETHISIIPNNETHFN
jgi:hypothetical protein